LGTFGFLKQTAGKFPTYFFLFVVLLAFDLINKKIVFFKKRLDDFLNEQVRDCEKKETGQINQNHILLLTKPLNFLQSL